MNHLERYIAREELESIKECEDLYLKSLTLVSYLFQDRRDLAGYPYIDHLKRVSNRMTTLEGKVAGLLHDTVEDIDEVTFDDLREIGIPEKIIEVLILVTNKKTNESLTKKEKLVRYGEKIDSIIGSGNLLAIELKISDMSDNYNPTRLALCSRELRDWFQLKYESQLEKLCNAYELIEL